MSTYIRWPATSGGGVTSINSLTGAVTLAAGSNITLTPSGNTITIASSPGNTLAPVYNSMSQVVLRDDGVLFNPGSGVAFIDPINRLLFTGGGATAIDVDTSSLVKGGVSVISWGGSDVDLHSNIISNLSDPVSAQDAATKNYVDTHGGGGGASTALDNLTTTSINQDLLPSITGTKNLGSSSLQWDQLNINSGIYNAGVQVIDTLGSQLQDATGTPSLNWNGRYLADSAGTTAIDWATNGALLLQAVTVLNANTSLLISTGNAVSGSLNLEYVPSTPGSWDGNPTSVHEALDRIAAALSGLLLGPIP